MKPYSVLKLTLPLIVVLLLIRYALFSQIEIDSDAATRKTVEMAASKIKYTIAGYTSCGYYKNALRVAQLVAQKNPNVQVENIGLTRPEFMDWLAKNLHSRGIMHRTSPAVLKNGDFVGGNDAFVASVQGMY